MTAHAYHYTLPDGVRGTLVAVDVHTVQQAMEEIARQHGCRAAEVNVRRAGEDIDATNMVCHTTQTREET